MAHAIRIRYASDASEKLQELTRFRDEHSEVLPEENTSITYREGDEITNAPAHYYAVIRFDDNEDLNALIDNLTEDVFAGVKWYVVHAHSCTHDGGGGACDDWSLERERGNVPEVYR